LPLLSSRMTTTTTTTTTTKTNKLYAALSLSFSFAYNVFVCLPYCLSHTLHEDN
jgi:hypothetical protein